MESVTVTIEIQDRDRLYNVLTVSVWGNVSVLGTPIERAHF